MLARKMILRIACHRILIAISVLVGCSIDARAQSSIRVYRTDENRLAESDSLFPVKLIPRSGIADPRRALHGVEVQQTSGVGYFHYGTGPVGTGFAVSSHVIVTAAHNFISGDTERWREEIRKTDDSLDISRIKYFVAICNKSYSIREVDPVRRDYRHARDSDIALVTLAEPLCRSAKPIEALALSENLIGQLRALKSDYIAVAGYQPYRREGDTGFGLLIGYGELLDLQRDDPAKSTRGLLIFTASTLPGSSGGPLLAFKNEQAVAIGVNMQESATGMWNLAVRIDESLKALIDTKIEAYKK